LSPLTPLCLPGIPSPTTSSRPKVAFTVATAPMALPGFTMHTNGSPRLPAETGSSSYGLPLHLRLLSTPPRSGAVTFDYMVATNRGTDSHRADKAPSRTHVCRSSDRHSRRRHAMARRTGGTPGAIGSASAG